MPLAEQILIAGLTIIGAILIFIFIQFFLKPILTLKEEIRQIHYLLTYYANAFENKGTVSVNNISERAKQAWDACRIHASELRAKTRAVYAPLLWVFRLPSKEKLSEISRNLIFLSNSYTTSNPDEIWKRTDNIKEILKFED